MNFFNCTRPCINLFNLKALLTTGSFLIEKLLREVDLRYSGVSPDLEALGCLNEWMNLLCGQKSSTTLISSSTSTGVSNARTALTLKIFSWKIGNFVLCGDRQIQPLNLRTAEHFPPIFEIKTPVLLLWVVTTPRLKQHFWPH